MSLIRHLSQGLRALTQRKAVDHELDDEVRHYLEMATRENMRAGMSRSAAEREARLDFGGVEVVKENVRSVGWDARVESVIRDVRYAARRFRAAPAYALVAITTLGTGMALTVGVVTVANAILRQEWPVSDPSRVVMIVQARSAPNFPLAEAKYFAERATTLSGIAEMRCVGGWYDECNLDLDGSPAAANLVSANYFSLLGIGIQAGRGFLPVDDQLQSPSAVAVMSDALWRGRFASDPAIVGKQVRVDGTPFTVIGIAARGFTGTQMESRDLWLPMSAMLILRPGRADVRDRFTNPLADHNEVSIAARLVPGATTGRALAELDALNRRFRAENGLDDAGLRLMATTFFPNPSKRRMVQAELGAMFAAVVLVLLLACANVGNLLLAQAAARGREIAVRLALGASRKRVVRQLLVESLLLAVIAGAMGLAIAFGVPAWVMTRAAGTVSWHLVPDTTVTVAAITLTALTCIAFGLAPAIHATRAEVAAVLKSGEQRTGQARSSSRVSLRGGLLAIQIAISVVLLVNAGTLVRGIQRGRDRDLGFSFQGVSVLSFGLPGSYDPEHIGTFVRQVTQESPAITGPTGVYAGSAPFSGEQFTKVHLPGESKKDDRFMRVVEISSGYFDLLKMPVVDGRDLKSSDGDDAVLINQSMARQLWPRGSAVGRTLVDSVDRRVIGVVKDANIFHLERVDPVIFRRVSAGVSPVLLVRSASPAVTRAIAAIATRIDPHAAVHVDSIAGSIDQALGGFRVFATLAGFLGLTALVIAGVGVFGVFGYLVQQRTREIGIRTALGASRAEVIALVLRDSAGSVGAGLVIGLGVAIASARVLESDVFGATAFDPVVFALTAILLACAGVAATYLPARRAARIDPAIALREQ